MGGGLSPIFKKRGPVQMNCFRLKCAWIFKIAPTLFLISQEFDEKIPENFEIRGGVK